MKKIIYKYNLMALATLAGVSANADIIYTDVNPDVTFTENEDQFEIDFDSDNNVDITIINSSTQFGFPGYFSINLNNVQAVPGSGNGILSISSSTGSVYQDGFLPLKANGLISAGQSFDSSDGILYGYASGSYGGPFAANIGNFNDTIYDRFIGVEFKSGTSTFYGWARVSAQAEKGSQSFTVYDYAYENSGEGILAGAGIVSPGSLSIDNEEFDNLKITNSNGLLRIISNDLINGTIIISDLSGKVVSSTNVNASEINLSTNDFDSGMYLVSIKTKEYQKAKKIIL